MCLGRGKAEIGVEKIRFVPFFTRGSYFRGTKMVLISAEPFFRFVHFYAWFLFSREQNGSYFRAHIYGSYFRGNKMVHIFAPTSKTRKYEHAKSKNAKMKSARKNGRLQYFSEAQILAKVQIIARFKF